MSVLVKSVTYVVAACAEDVARAARAMTETLAAIWNERFMVHLSGLEKQNVSNQQVMTRIVLEC